MINGGIYAVEFTGHTLSEFQGLHPAIVINNNKQSELYYVIPLTSYTEERWEKYKSHLACKIKSTNSIALTHQMQIKPYSDIKHRYVNNNGVLLTITNNELKNVNEKLLLLLNQSIKEVEKSHKKYETFLNNFKKQLIHFVQTNEIDKNMFNISYLEERVILTYNSTLPKKYFCDYKNIAENILSKYDINISNYNKKFEIIINNFKTT